LVIAEKAGGRTLAALARGHAPGFARAPRSSKRRRRVFNRSRPKTPYIAVIPPSTNSSAPVT
jgi:hypothetical protein